MDRDKNLQGVLALGKRYIGVTLVRKVWEKLESTRSTDIL